MIVKPDDHFLEEKYYCKKNFGYINQEKQTDEYEHNACKCWFLRIIKVLSKEP